MNIGIVLLAAGSSARLGSPKQLLAFRGQTLLRHAAQTALATGRRPVLAVLGRDAERMRAELAGLDVQTVENPVWGQGLGTSVRRGVAALVEAAGEGLDAVLLTLCDQPLVTTGMLEELVTALAQNPAAGIAAAAYGGTVGVPALFAREFFDELRAVPDDAGARPVLRRHRDRVAAVPLPEAATDIDTREQYERLAGG